ncbi:MAG: hypothetical protein FWG98_14805 [Candidatus Cloacimonetes bacterium]|nr:hypothetical protein [Candidatus Cloacimonadota bacterium]
MPKSVKKLILIIISIVIAVLNISCSSEKFTEPEPQDWTSGELYAKLNEDIKDEALEEFLLSYSEYELKIIFHDRLGNRFRFSFDYEKINEFKFLELMKNDQRVIWIRFQGQLPDWAPGIIIAQLHAHVREELLEEFLNSYSEYELKIDFQVLKINYFRFLFNYEIIDEFDFLLKIQNDDRVIWAVFNYDDYIIWLVPTDNRNTQILKHNHIEEI